MSKLKQLAEAKGLTPDAISRETGLSISTINRWFSGEKEPYPSVIVQLCNILDCSQEDLMGSEANTHNAAEKVAALTHKSVVIKKDKDTKEEVFNAMPLPCAPEGHEPEAVPGKSRNSKSKETPVEVKKDHSSYPTKTDASTSQTPNDQYQSADVDALKGIPKKILKDREAMSEWIFDYANKIKQDTNSSIDRMVAAVRVVKGETGTGQLSADALEMARRYDKLNPSDQEFIKKMISKL